MKKLIAALFAAVLMAAGLVVATGSTASANCDPSTQYGGCTRTVTKAQVPDVAAQGERARICARVNAVNSNAKPEGRVIFKINRKGGGYFEKQAVAYEGGKTCITTRVLNRKGKYLVVAKFQSDAGSTFTNSRGENDFRVQG